MTANQNIKAIAIVGPESTGKSELSAALAGHYKTIWVKEFAREYLEGINRPYNYDDLLQIAKGQLKLEEEAKHKLVSSSPNSDFKTPPIFCDTNLTVIKVWSEFKYQQCDTWILNQIKTRKYFLHLLTDIDLPWQDDPLREHPQQRRELFNIYYDELINQEADFEIVSGINDERILNAIHIIDSRMKHF